MSTNEASRGILRIAPRFEHLNALAVEITWTPANGEELQASCSFEYRRDAGDEEQLRWYLEDFADGSAQVDTALASRVEAGMERLGEELFAALFDSEAANRRLWERVRPELAGVDVRIVPDLRAAHAIRWELIREPALGSFLALRARTFCYCGPGELPVGEAAGARALMVVARPLGADDVPYLSTARAVLAGLRDCSESAPAPVVVRPATFGRLADVLAGAAEEGRPFRLLHFDGHGVYDSGDGVAKSVYVAFERPDGPGEHLVSGAEFVDLVAAHGIDVVVLGACRSGFAEVPDTTLVAGIEADDRAVSAFGSLAQQLTHAGIGAVVAMGYRVRTSVVSIFSRALYRQLGRGQPVESATAAARRALHVDPMRIGRETVVRVQDWVVPQLHLSRLGLRLFGPGELRPNRRPPQDRAFIGRDDELLALERAFLTSSRVLLRGERTGGKSAIVREFADWYASTGGVRGEVVHTSLADGAGPAWTGGAGLWIVDDAEAATADEIGRFGRALAAAEAAGVRVLLTGKGPLLDWEKGATAIDLPPLGDAEALAIVRDLQGSASADDLARWRPAIGAAQGNVGTLTELAGIALEADGRGAAPVAAIVASVMSGQTDPTPLRRALETELRREFDAGELRRVALLHMFRGGTDTTMLRGVARTSPELPFVNGMEQGDWERLLARTAKLGLATPIGSTVLGGTVYRLHPMLSAALRGVFVTAYGDRESDLQRAYVAALATNALMLSTRAAGDDPSEVIRALRSDFALALDMARHYGMTQGISYLTEILGTAFDHRGAEWRAIVENVASTSGAEATSSHEEYRRVMAAMKKGEMLRREHRLHEAVEFTRGEIRWLRTFMATAPETDEEGRPNYYDEHLAALLRKLGQALEELHDPECLDVYEQSFRIALDGGHDRFAATAAMSLGGALTFIETTRDLDKARMWLERARGLLPDDDREGNSVAFGKLAEIEVARWRERKAAGRSGASLNRVLDDAVELFERALAELPESSLAARGAICNNLGLFLEQADEFDRAIEYLEAALAVADELEDREQQGGVLQNIAVALVNSGRLPEARQRIEQALQLLSHLPAEHDLVLSTAEKHRDILERIERTTTVAKPSYDADDRTSALIEELVELGARHPFLGDGRGYDRARRLRRARKIGVELRNQSDEALRAALERVSSALGERQARDLEQVWLEL